VPKPPEDLCMSTGQSRPHGIWICRRFSGSLNSSGVDIVIVIYTDYVYLFKRVLSESLAD
jgi:hypothetical protein